MTSVAKSLTVQASLLVFLGWVLSLGTMHGQAAKSDFSFMVAAGTVNGDIYQNSMLGITLSLPRHTGTLEDPSVLRGDRGG